MHKSANLYFFSLALSLSVACSAGAFCLKGDLNGNCEVNFEDVLSLASEWLGPAGSDGDLVGNDGVNSADFAELAKNWGKSRSKVIINEIHYDPDVKTELVEYVELHNRSEVDVNIGDWYFSSGISYQFPAGTILVAGDYVVAAQTPTLVCSKYGVSAGKVFGPWVGKLSNEGEEVVLRDSDGAKVDAVDYKLGFPWPTVGCPPGDSIELVNPLFDNDLGGNWRPSEPDTISPPRVIIESQSTWRYFKGYSEASEPNHAAWREIGFDDSSWDQGDLVIGYGEGGGFLTTVLDDMRYNYSSVYLRKTFEIDDPGAIGNLVLEAIYDDGFNVYINNKHVRNVNMQNDEMPYDGTARSALEDLNWNTFNLPPASEYLVAGTNVIAVHLHNASLRDSSDCFLDVRLKETFSSTSAGPTPGRQNTAYSENDAPQIRQVDHEPSQPRSGEDVKITAKVTDNDGVEYVMLFYQRVDAGSYIELSDPAYETNWSMAEMHDDGLAGDETAGDDIYTAVLSGSNQVHRRLVRYRISVWDYTGVSTEAPYRYDYESEPVPNFAYFVYDGVPSWFGSARPGYTPVVEYGPEVLTHVPVYHLISKKQSVVDAMHIPNSTAGEYWGDSYPWYGTLVYDGKVYDHIRYRARGGCWRYSMGKNMWKFDFNRAESFQARDDYGEKYDTKWRKLNFSACIQQGDTGYRGEQGMLEAAGFKLFNLAGVEAPKTHWVHFRVIDEYAESGATQYEGDFWGLYLVLEQVDGRFLDEHKLPDGNLYKMEGGSGDLNNQGATAVTDKSDLNSFINGYKTYPPTSWWLENVDVDRYFNYRTIVDGIHHYDIGADKNYFYYLNPVANGSGDYLWSELPWDLDLTWGDDMYDCGNRGNSPFKRYGLWENSDLRIRRNNRIREIRDLCFNSDQGWQLLDDFAAVVDDAAGGAAIVDADRAMWDYNPILVSSYVNLGKAGHGKFYQKPPTHDFPGMVQIMKDYLVQRCSVGDPRTTAEPGLDPMCYDASIPYTPTVSYQGVAGYPINTLVFRTSSFTDPQGSGSFGGMKWRIAEVTDLSNPHYEPGDSKKYEIESVWESDEMTAFQSDIRIPAAAVKVGRTYRVRCRMKDNTDRWSHWSDPLQFISGDAVSAGILDNLRITEMMYNPADADTDAGESDEDNDEFEFIEIKNIGDEVLDLTYVSFIQGISFAFAGSDVTSLGPGEFVLVVRNKAVFESRYGTGLSGIIAGQYIDTDTNLSNSMETVELADLWEGSIVKFSYSDGRGWPLPADGSGHSQVPLASAIAGEGAGSLNYGGNWRISAYIGGSPGADDPELPASVMLNEVMAHTDYSNPAYPEHDSDDWIELYNTAGTTVNLSGWYLSDDKDKLDKWAIPSVSINGNGWLSFDEVTGFHNPYDSGFGLNKAGDEVLLSYLPGTSEDRVVDYVRFKGEENSVSLGRYPDGGGFWLHMAPSQDSANNSGVLDVVIDEIMYHPVEPDEEYVELYNPTGSRVYLENGVDCWRLDDEDTEGYKFASGTYIEAGGRLIIVGFDPATETARLNAFIAAYGTGPLTAGVDIVGPMPGNLSNSGERLALKRPQAPDEPEDPVSWVVVDEAIYSDYAPWPVGADGLGSALQRIAADQYHSGNDPANWESAGPTPGGAP